MRPQDIFWDYEDFLKIKERICREEKPVVIYGAGFWGQALLELFHCYGISAACFCDNDPQKQGTQFQGLLVNDYETCRNAYGDEAFWFIAIYNPEIRSMLSQRIALTPRGEGGCWEINEIINIELNPDAIKQAIEMLTQPIVLLGKTGLAQQVALHSIKPLNQQAWVYCANPYEQDLSMISAEIEVSTLEECRKRFPQAIYLICYQQLIWDCTSETPPYVERVKSFLMDGGISASAISEQISPWILTPLPLKKPSVIPVEIHKLKIEHFHKVLLYKTIRADSTTFFNSVMDFHPNILYLGHNVFQANILFLIWQVQSLPKEDMLQRLIELFEQQAQEESARDLYIEQKLFFDRERFRSAFLEAVEGRDTLSDRDIFIAVHIAHFYMLGRTYCSTELPVIYMEPHFLSNVKKVLHRWLRENFQTYVGVTCVRNTVTAIGSRARKTCFLPEREYWSTISELLKSGLGEKVFEDGEPSMVFRFEDVKLHPHETLKHICSALSIPWSDTFLKTTDLGLTQTYTARDLTIRTTGYDLRPVYASHDKYTNSFDRFRLEILLRERQKAYGYPFIDLKQYPFRDEQLREWFTIPFQFESVVQWASEQSKKQYREKLYSLCVEILKKLEQSEKYPALFQFDNYIRI